MILSRFSIPLLVLAALVGGYLLRNAFTKPTTDVVFAAVGDKTVTCTVSGLKCKGTARFFTNLYKETDGIASIETFAAEHQAVIRYDSKQITADSIRAIMETPVPLRDGTSRQVFVCEAMK